jgi:hypothetical protein
MKDAPDRFTMKNLLSEYRDKPLTRSIPESLAVNHASLGQPPPVFSDETRIDEHEQFPQVRKLFFDAPVKMHFHPPKKQQPKKIPGPMLLLSIRGLPFFILKILVGPQSSKAVPSVRAGLLTSSPFQRPSHSDLRTVVRKG